MNAILTSSLQVQLDSISSTRGNLLCRDASDWTGIPPGTSGYVLTSNGPGANPSYQAAGGGGGSPGGSDTQIQYNDSGGFGGNADFTYDKATGYAYIGGLRIKGTDSSNTLYSVSGNALVMSAGGSVRVGANGESGRITYLHANGTGTGISVTNNGWCAIEKYLQFDDLGSAPSLESGTGAICVISGEVTVVNSSTAISPLTGPGSVLPGTFTVATLPSASAYAQSRSIVTDALLPTFGATVAGSGAVIICVFSDGTNWIVG